MRERLGAVEQRAAAGAGALEADEEHGVARVAESVLEVVEDTAAVHHAAAGNDDDLLAPVERLRLLARAAAGEALDGEGALVGADQRREVLVVLAGELLVELGGADRHRAVEEDALGGEAPGVGELGEVVEQVLRAAEREGGDEHARRRGRRSRRWRRRAPRARPPWSGGGRRRSTRAAACRAALAGGSGSRRIGHVVAADVAREAPAAALAVAALGGELDGGGAEQVAGAAQPHRDRRAAPRRARRRRRGGSATAPAWRPRRGRAGVGSAWREKPLRRAKPASSSCSLAASRSTSEVRPRLGAAAVDRAAVAARGEQRQPAAVVEVGVGEHHRVEVVRREREGLAVALLELDAALEEPAVDEDAALAPLQQRHAAGDRAAGAEEGDVSHPGES